MTSKRAVIAGCARNCAGALPYVLANVERIAAQFSDVAHVFVENDSTDSTKSQLSAWGAKRNHFHLICLDGLAQPGRTRGVRLEIARNSYLEFLQNSDFQNHDYLIVLDMDNANERPLDQELVAQSIDFLESDPTFAAGFANQEGFYYDLWALRHPQICPGDVWEELLDYVVANSVSDEVGFEQTFKKRIFSISATQKPLEVLSAFGGLGLYKMKYALQGKYLGKKQKTIRQDDQDFQVGWQVCEHVHFNQMIREQGGKLFILPWLINWIPPPGTQFPPSAYRALLFDLA